MSTIQVSEKHLAFLVREALRRQLIAADAATFAMQLLARENLKSLQTVHGAGYASDYSIEDLAYDPRVLESVPLLSPIGVLKQIQYFTYQSSDHDGWYTSHAAHFCTLLRNNVLHSLPGYDAAPWGL